MQAVLARRDLTVGQDGHTPGDVAPVSCFGPHEVRFARGGREAPGEEEVSSSLSAREPAALLPLCPVMPPDVTSSGAEDAALGLLGLAGMVAVRAADLASPCRRGLGADGQTALVAAGTARIRFGGTGQPSLRRAEHPDLHDLRWLRYHWRSRAEAVIRAQHVGPQRGRGMNARHAVADAEV
jgi:hypothetical protein